MDIILVIKLLIVYHVFMFASGVQFKRRNDLKLKPSFTRDTCLARSLLGCITCAQAHLYVTISWDSSSATCLVSDHDSIHDNEAWYCADDVVGWITLSEIKYQVFIGQERGGRYTFINFQEAQAYCLSIGSSGLASVSDLYTAYNLGMEMCNCGWVSDGSIRLVLQTPNSICKDTYSFSVAEEIHKIVSEVQTSNRFILRRLNHTVSGKTQGQCCCTRNELAVGDFSGLETKIRALENNDKQNQDMIAELTNQIKVLKETVKGLQVQQSHTIASDHQSSCSVDKQYLNNAMPVLKLSVNDPTILSNGTKTKHSNEDGENTDSGNENDKAPSHIACNVFENIPNDTNETGQENKTVNSDNDHEAKAKENKVCTANTIDNKLDSNKDHTVEKKLVSQKSDSGKLDASCAKTDSMNAKASSKPDQRTTTIERPNFIRDKKDISGNAPVIRKIESKKASHPDSNYWGFLATLEHSDAEKQLKDLDGAHTVICVDISSSMADGNAWTHASTFVNDYIEGLEHVQKEHGLHDDHISLVTFGHDTRVVQRLTNDFTKIRNAFGGISLGGPTPMCGGISMALAAGGSSEKQIYEVNNHIVTTKIILISDMHPTDTCMYQGPDVADPRQLDETKSQIIARMEQIQTTAVLDIFFVPVGNGSKEFLDLMQAVSEGKKLHFKQGRHFSRRLYLTNLAPDPLGIITPFGNPKLSGSDKARLSEDDLKHLEEIKAEGMKHMLRRLAGGMEREHKDTDSDTLPPVGVRVRRGPDWRWESQDNYGPGTVVGHSEDGKHAWVQWDNNEERGAFRYRYSGNYDVLIVDEPRIVTDGKIVVGCTVKPGKDFPYASSKIKQLDSGIAIRLSKENRTVNVKWNNKEKGEYKYASSHQDTEEVELATPLSSRVLRDCGTIAKEQSTSKNKNKNS